MKLSDAKEWLPSFGRPYGNYEHGHRWDNYELFVQPEEALRGEEG